MDAECIQIAIYSSRQESVLGNQLGCCNTKHRSQPYQLKVSDPSRLALNAGNDVTGNIPSGQLALCGQSGLRPSEARANLANLRPANVQSILARVKIHTGQ